MLLLLLTQTARADAENQRLRLATWNLEWLRPEFRPNSSKKRTDNDYKELAEVFSRMNPDILAVQEIGSEKLLARIADVARFQVALENRDSDQRTGFLIRKNISWVRHPDVNLNLGHRGLRQGVHIQLSSDTGTVHLLSIHLASGCWENELNSTQHGCLRLKRQLPILTQWLKQHSSGSSTAIILGDFNRRLNASGEFWKRLDRDMNMANTRTTSPTIGQSSLCPSHTSGKPLIDHIVLSGSGAKPLTFQEHVWTREEHNRHLLSDHCPLSIDLSIGLKKL